MKINFPNDIMIEVTNECNLKCITCYSHQDNREKKYMSKYIFEKIINEIPYKKNKTISLYNYWEPLLHPNIWYFVKYAKDNWVKSVKIATNWTFLSSKKSLELINSWLDYISVSIDWITQEIYEKFRIWWNLKKIISNLQKLVKLKNILWKWPIIELQFIIMSLNEHQIENIEILAKKIWVNILRYKTVLIKEKKWNYLIPKNDSYSRYIPTNKINCNKAQEWIVVNVDWTVIPCCYITDKQIKNYKLWNILKDSFENIFYSEKSINFIKQTTENKNKLEYCNKCQEWNLNLDYKVINLQW